MIDLIQPYQPSVLAAGGMGLLLFVQVIVADIAAIWAHTEPGRPLEFKPASFHFRASRSYHNTNESIAAFILLWLFCVMVEAHPATVNAMACLYVAGRVGHMLCYYAAWNLARTFSFVAALLGLLGLIAAGVQAC